MFALSSWLIYCSQFRNNLLDHLSFLASLLAALHCPLPPCPREGEVSVGQLHILWVYHLYLLPLEWFVSFWGSTLISKRFSLLYCVNVFVGVFFPLGSHSLSATLKPQLSWIFRSNGLLCAFPVAFVEYWTEKRKALTEKAFHIQLVLSMWPCSTIATAYRCLFWPEFILLRP